MTAKGACAIKLLHPLSLLSLPVPSLDHYHPNTEPLGYMEFLSKESWVCPDSLLVPAVPTIYTSSAHLFVAKSCLLLLQFWVFPVPLDCLPDFVLFACLYCLPVADLCLCIYRVFAVSALSGLIIVLIPSCRSLPVSLLHCYLLPSTALTVIPVYTAHGSRAYWFWLGIVTEDFATIRSSSIPISAA